MTRPNADTLRGLEERLTRYFGRFDAGETLDEIEQIACDLLAALREALAPAPIEATAKMVIAGGKVWPEGLSGEVYHQSPLAAVWRAMRAASSEPPALAGERGEPPGYRLVPVEPTLQMKAAGADADEKHFAGRTAVGEIYRAMLAAAPPQPAERPADEGLRELLKEALKELEADEVEIDGEWGAGRSLEELERDNDLRDIVLKLRAALAGAAPQEKKP